MGVQVFVRQPREAGAFRAAEAGSKTKGKGAGIRGPRNSAPGAEMRLQEADGIRLGDSEHRREGGVAGAGGAVFDGRQFRADRASILLDELGLKNLHLRQYLSDRRKFFDNKERLQKLKVLVEPNDIASDLDRKMIATVVKAEQPEWFNIVRTLYHAYIENVDEIDLQTEPAAWEQIEKFDLDKPFWEMAHATFGYAEDAPTLKNLLLRLFVTDYVHHLKSAPPSALVHLVLPTQGRSNAVV